MQFLSTVFYWFYQVFSGGAELLQAHPILVQFSYFLMIFLETSCIAFWWLPGDLFLIILGGLVAQGYLDYFCITAALSCACIFGSSINYLTGRWLFPRIKKRFIQIESETSAHLKRAEVLYQQYGGFALIISRFIPILRSLMPLLSGAAKTAPANFMIYNVIGAILWVGGFVGFGFFLSEVPYLKRYERYISTGFFLLMLSSLVVTILRKTVFSGKQKTLEKAS